MLAAETPSMEAHMAAATPRRRGEAGAFPIKLIEIKQQEHICEGNALLSCLYSGMLTK